MAVSFCLDISKGAFWGMVMMKVGVMNTTVFSISYLPGHLMGSDGCFFVSFCLLIFNSRSPRALSGV